MMEDNRNVAQWLFVVRLTRPDMLTSGPTESEMQSVGNHFAYWKSLTQKGVALVVGRTQTTGADTMGLAIFQAADEAAALEIAALDPAVVDGVFSSNVYPYYVALLGDPTPFSPQV